eukprot:7466769-Pyramimonas_sp.AAC.1
MALVQTLEQRSQPWADQALWGCVQEPRLRLVPGQVGHYSLTASLGRFARVPHLRRKAIAMSGGANWTFSIVGRSTGNPNIRGLKTPAKDPC